MIEHIAMLVMGVVCFTLSFMNSVLSDKFWFAQLVAFVSVITVPVSLILPDSTLIFVVAVAWQLMVIMIGKTMDLKQYHIILWLYPLVMMTIFLKWMFWKQGLMGFDEVYVRIFYGTNVIQALLFLVLSDAGWNFVNKIRNHSRSSYVLDDRNRF